MTTAHGTRRETSTHLINSVIVGLFICTAVPVIGLFSCVYLSFDIFCGIQIYDHCPWDEKRNFNTFINSVLLLFFVTTGDSSWTDTMHRGMRTSSSPLAGLIFFLFFYMVSVYCICNLFICVILSAFEMEEGIKESIQMQAYRSVMLSKLLKNLKKIENAAGNEPIDDTKESRRKKASVAEGLFGNEDHMENVHIEDDSDGEGAEEEDTEYYVLLCLPPPLPSKRLPEQSPNFRYVIRKIVRWKAYNRLVLTTILASAVLLAADSRIRSKSLVTPEIVLYADYVFYGIFMMEFIMKVLDNGIAFEGPEAYFRKGWNWIDFVLLVAQSLDFLGVDGVKALRVLRVLRPLRSLRILNKIEKLQLMIMAISQSVLDVLNVLFLWLFAFLIFGIIGMTLFSGRLHRCSDSEFVGYPLNPGELPGSKVGWRENCVGAHISFMSGIEGMLDTERYYTSVTSPTGILRPRVWSPPAHAPSEVSFSFDDFASTCQTLYEVSTLRGWSKYVYAAIDATSPAQHPISNNSPGVMIYFVLWVLVSSFFIVQMVIGVLIDAINQQTGTAMFTAPQRNWMRTLQKMKACSTLVPILIPTNPVIKNVWLLTNNPIFQNFYTGVILFNIGLMATEHYNQPAWYDQTAFALNSVLLGLYIVEIIIKVTATLPNVKIFFLDVGNVFDLLVVIASVVDIALSTGGGKSGLQALRVLRVVRVFRTLRFVRRSPRLMVMVNTMVASVPGIIAILGFLGLQIFIFSILGNQFFSGLKFGTGLNRRNNFDSPWDGMLTLFVTVTGDGWVGIMRDAGIQEPMCTSQAEVDAIRQEHLELYGRVFFPDPEMDVSDCGSTVGATLYFDLFYFLGFQFLRSLFIAGMMENFFAFKSSGNFILADGHLESYRRKWRQLDPGARGYIELHRLRTLCESLSADYNPLGTSALTNEFKYGMIRIELTRQAQSRAKKAKKADEAVEQLKLEKMTKKKRAAYLAAKEVLHVASDRLRFNDVLICLGKHAVGTAAMPYLDMKRRIAQLNWYGKLAAGGQMVAIFRGMKERKRKRAQAMGLTITGSLAAMGEDANFASANEISEKAQMMGKGTRSDKKKPTLPSATVAETVLSSLAHKDLERSLQDLHRMRDRLHQLSVTSSSGTTSSEAVPTWRREGGGQEVTEDEERVLGEHGEWEHQTNAIGEQIRFGHGLSRGHGGGGVY